jgi:hypothetical protein
VRSKNILQRLDGHDGVTLWVDTHPYLDMIVSCGLDRKVKIWVDEDMDVGGQEDGGMHYDTPKLRIGSQSPDATATQEVKVKQEGDE